MLQGYWLEMVVMPDMAILLACLGESFDSGDVFKWVCWEMSVYYREHSLQNPPFPVMCYPHFRQSHPLPKTYLFFT